MLELHQIDRTWTLFLDRDGVINEEKHMDYVRNYREFHFMPGVLDALAALNPVFGPIVIVTNQRGIGRGLMTDEDLADIHEQMVRDIVHAGGRIDKIYYCSSMNNEHPNRKPNPGMALLAKEEIAQIDLGRALVVGNNISDMEFGRRAGIHTVHVRTTHPDLPNPHPMIDLSVADLPEFCQKLLTAKQP